MSETNPPAEPAPVAAGPTAAWLGACLLAGLLVQTIIARIDRGRVASLESFSESTAVGDRIFYTIPSPAPNPPVAVARVKGEALVPVSYEKFDCRDTKMTPAARDPATKLTIYECREPLPDTSEGKTYFVKTSPNEYLRLRAGTATAP